GTSNELSCVVAAVTVPPVADVATRLGVEIVPVITAPLFVKTTRGKPFSTVAASTVKPASKASCPTPRAGSTAFIVMMPLITETFPVRPTEGATGLQVKVNSSVFHHQ